MPKELDILLKTIYPEELKNSLWVQFESLKYVMDTPNVPINKEMSQRN